SVSWWVSIGVEEIRSILLPRMSTDDGADSLPLVPSKMRTFWNTVAAGACVCAWSGAVSPQTRTKAMDLPIRIIVILPNHVVRRPSTTVRAAAPDQAARQLPPSRRTSLEDGRVFDAHPAPAGATHRDIARGLSWAGYLGQRASRRSFELHCPP